MESPAVKFGAVDAAGDGGLHEQALERASDALHAMAVDGSIHIRVTM